MTVDELTADASQWGNVEVEITGIIVVKCCDNDADFCWLRSTDTLERSGNPREEIEQLENAILLIQPYLSDAILACGFQCGGWNIDACEPARVSGTVIEVNKQGFRLALANLKKVLVRDIDVLPKTVHLAKCARERQGLFRSIRLWWNGSA